MGALRPSESIDFASKSHVYDAVWTAASSPLSTFDIADKKSNSFFCQAKNG